MGFGLGLKASLIKLSMTTCIFHGFLVLNLFVNAMATHKSLLSFSCLIVMIIYILNISNVILTRIKGRDYSLNFSKWSFTIAAIFMLIAVSEDSSTKDFSYFALSLTVFLLPVCLQAILFWLSKNIDDGDYERILD